MIYFIFACAPVNEDCSHVEETDHLENSQSFVLPQTVMHAHNDYEHSKPLWDALSLGFRSVEADIFLRDDQLMVSHIGIIMQGTLESLYIQPLLQRIHEYGSVLGDDKPFTLWIDLKEQNEKILEKLLQTLSPYSEFATVNTWGFGAEPIHVIVTGANDDAKEFLRRNAAFRRFAIDSASIVPTDPIAQEHTFEAYSISWQAVNSGFLSSSYSANAEQMIQCAHAQNRAVRFYGMPEEASLWKSLRDLGVDYLGADDLEKLADFWNP